MKKHIVHITLWLAVVFLVAAIGLAYASLPSRYSEVVRKGVDMYGINDKGQGVTLARLADKNVWLVAFTDCVIPFTTYDVAEVDGVKTIVEFSQEIGKNTGVIVIRDTIDVHSFHMDIPCDGVSLRTIDIELPPNWRDTL